MNFGILLWILLFGRNGHSTQTKGRETLLMKHIPLESQLAPRKTLFVYEYTLNNDHVSFPFEIPFIFEQLSSLQEIDATVTSGRWIHEEWGNQHDLKLFRDIPPNGFHVHVQTNSSSLSPGAEEFEYLKSHITLLLGTSFHEMEYYRRESLETWALDPTTRLCVDTVSQWTKLHPCQAKAVILELFGDEQLFSSWYSSVRIQIRRNDNRLEFTSSIAVVSDSVSVDAEIPPFCSLIAENDIIISKQHEQSLTKLHRNIVHQRWKSGKGNRKGLIVTSLTNNFSRNLPICISEHAPKFISILSHTIKAFVHDTVPHPLEIFYTPELIRVCMEIPPSFTVLIKFKYETRFLRIEEYPPDIYRGIDHPFTFIQFNNDNNQTSTIFLDPISIIVPSPDRSMPFNVIIISCTFFSFLLVSIVLALVRSQEQLSARRDKASAKWDKFKHLVSHYF